MSQYAYVHGMPGPVCGGPLLIRRSTKADARAVEKLYVPSRRIYCHGCRKVFLNTFVIQPPFPLAQAPAVRGLRAGRRQALRASRNATRQVTKAEGKLSVSDLTKEELEGKRVRELAVPWC